MMAGDNDDRFPRSRRVYGYLYPTGLWTEPCDVRCECGYKETFPTCTQAQVGAWLHNRRHFTPKPTDDKA